VAAKIRRPIDRADLDGLRLTLDELERSRDPELPVTRRTWLLAVWLIRWCGFTVPILAMVVWLTDRSNWLPVVPFGLHLFTTAASLVFAMRYRSTEMSPMTARTVLTLTSLGLGLSMGLTMPAALTGPRPEFMALLCLLFAGVSIAIGTLTTSFVPSTFVAFACGSVGLYVVFLIDFGGVFGIWMSIGAIVVLGSLLIVGLRLHVLLRGAIEGRIAQADLSEQLTEALERLDRIAATDDLTGLSNRRRFMGQLESLLAQASTVSTCIILFDIDHFKAVNDVHGHAAGDQVLRHVAGAIRNTLRSGDLVGRVGGEEFAVLCSVRSEEVAEAVAHRLRHSIMDIRVPEVPELRVSASFGVAHLQPHHTPADALAAADGPLYRAKAEGRNTVRCAGLSAPDSATERHRASQSAAQPAAVADLR
jgi:diguanylate cyclase (GGDEF)-like protein